jgi:hypothetical protein
MASAQHRLIKCDRVCLEKWLVRNCHVNLLTVVNFLFVFNCSETLQQITKSGPKSWIILDRLGIAAGSFALRHRGRRAEEGCN